jgi:hypothetical protein
VRASRISRLRADPLRGRRKPTGYLSRQFFGCVRQGTLCRRIITLRFDKPDCYNNIVTVWTGCLAAALSFQGSSAFIGNNFDTFTSFNADDIYNGSDNDTIANGGGQWRGIDRSNQTESGKVKLSQTWSKRRSTSMRDLFRVNSSAFDQFLGIYGPRKNPRRKVTNA